MKIATYLRVSTTDQTLDPQRLELSRYCELRGWTISMEYSDVISGAKSSRSGLDALMADIRKGKVKAVMAAKIDRLARSLPHFAQIIGELKSLKVALIIPGQNIDTTDSNPTGELTMNILASIAEFERSLIKDRTIAGLQAARQRGVVLGRPKGTKLNIPVAQARTAIANGQTIRGWAKENGFAEASVRKAMKAAGE